MRGSALISVLCLNGYSFAESIVPLTFAGKKMPPLQATFFVRECFFTGAMRYLGRLVPNFFGAIHFGSRLGFI